MTITAQETRKQLKNERQFRKQVPVGFTAMLATYEDGKTRASYWKADQREARKVASALARDIINGRLRDAIMFNKVSKTRSYDLATFYAG